MLGRADAPVAFDVLHLHMRLVWLRLGWDGLAGPRLRRLGACVLVLGACARGPAAGQFRPRPHKAAAPAAPVPLAADPPEVRQRLFQAASLQNSFKESEALATYQEVLKISPNHYLALWQSAVLSARIGTRYTDDTRKAAYFDAARQYADRALALRPEGGESNYAVAVALFNQATLYRAGSRLAAFRELRSHVYLATERRPDLPEAWELLGRWQYRVSHYNLLERVYSKLILGGVPAGGNSRDAMSSLEKARELGPNNLQFCYDLARMCQYQGRRRRAIEVLREAEKITALTSEDLVISRLCRQMLPPLVRADARRQRRLGRQRPLQAAPRQEAGPAPADSLRSRPAAGSG